MTYPRRFAMESPDQYCVVPDGCVSTETFSTEPFLIVLWAGLLAFIVVVALVHIRSARSLLEEEQKRTTDERDAFDEFTRRVTTVEVSQSPAAVQAQGAVTPLAETTSDGRLEQVREAYRDTVMSVPHYEEEYDESLATNMAAEFTDELAAAVTDGSTLTPTVKEALVRQSEEARSRREDFLDRLDEEGEELADARETLVDIERVLDRMNRRPLRRRSFDDLADSWHRLRALEDECAELLVDRQESIHDRSGDTHRADTPPIQSYLYQSSPVTFPILADGVGVVEKIRTARRRVAAALTRRA